MAMSIWSRIVDGVTELRWGSLFGLGDGLDQAAAESSRPAATKAMGFTIAVIALSAKMAKADGEVSAEEIAAFREVFQAAPEDMANVTYFFNLARRHATGADTYARQVARLLDGNQTVLEDLLGALFHIAKADGRLDPAEDAYLRQISRIFGFEETDYRRIRAYHVGEVSDGGIADDPFLVLGLTADATAEELKARHRDLVRENHPDTLMARGLPAEFAVIANGKLARINAAYDRIRAARRRGMN
jgi:DnaJ like chaperone protein